MFFFPFVNVTREKETVVGKTERQTYENTWVDSQTDTIQRFIRINKREVKKDEA